MTTAVVHVHVGGEIDLSDQRRALIIIDTSRTGLSVPQTVSVLSNSKQTAECSKLLNGFDH